MIWNYLEALLKRHSMYSLIVAYGKKGKREITANDDIPQFTLQRAHCQEHRIWMSHMNCECSIAIVTKQKAPSLSARKGSFEGHWSGSYCPGGRQIGPVKPHCESDWNWFVVLLLHHPIKRRSLREREWERDSVRDGGGGVGGRGRGWQRGENESKGGWLDHGTLMLQAKPRFFLVLRHHSRGRAGEATGEQNTDAHSVPDTQAFCNTGRNDPQAISLGTIHRDEVTEKNLMRLRDGKTGSDETGLFVQQIGTTRGVTDTQWRGWGRSCHRHPVMAGGKPSYFPQVCWPSTNDQEGCSRQAVLFLLLNSLPPCFVSVTVMAGGSDSGLTTQIIQKQSEWLLHVHKVKCGSEEYFSIIVLLHVQFRAAVGRGYSQLSQDERRGRCKTKGVIFV